MQPNRHEPPLKTTVGVFFEDGAWCQATWIGTSYVTPYGGSTPSKNIGSQPMREAIALARTRRAEHEARRAAA